MQRARGAECNEAFQTIKEYIASPLSLSQPIEGEELYIYLSSSGSAISAALVRLDSKKRQRPVYFVNKALSEVEVRYSDFERVALALRMVAKKLRPYFQTHTIMVLLTDQGHNPQTGHIRGTTKVGGGIERVRHRVSIHNYYQGACVGRLHCGEVRSVKEGGG